MNYLNTLESEFKLLSTKLTLGMMNGFLLRLMEPRSGKDNSKSSLVVLTYVDLKLQTGMNKSLKLMRSSIMTQKKLEFLSLLLLTRMLLMNHGDSENTNFSMTPNRNALHSTQNVILRELNSDSAEDLLISEKTVFPPLLDQLRSLPKVE
jgi:hypothetical protein